MKKYTLSLLSALLVVFLSSNVAFAFFDASTQSGCPAGQAYYNADGYTSSNGEYIKNYSGCGTGKAFACADGTMVTVPNFYLPLNEYKFYQLCPTPTTKIPAVMISVATGEYLTSQTEGTANITIPKSAEGKVIIFSSKSYINWVISNPDNITPAKIVLIATMNVNTQGNVDIAHHQRLTGDVPAVPIEKPYVIYAGPDRDTYFLKKGYVISSEDTYSAERAGDLPRSISPNGTPFGDKIDTRVTKIVLSVVPAKPIVGDSVTITWSNNYEDATKLKCQLSIASIGNMIKTIPNIAKSGSYVIPSLKQAGVLDVTVSCPGEVSLNRELVKEVTSSVSIGDGKTRGVLDTYRIYNPDVLHQTTGSNPYSWGLRENLLSYVHTVVDDGSFDENHARTYTPKQFTEEEAYAWCKAPRTDTDYLMCFWNNKLIYAKDKTGMIDLTNTNQISRVSSMPTLTHNGVVYGKQTSSSVGTTPASSQNTSALPSGCTSSTAYSRTTGVRCVNSSIGTGSSSNRTPDGSSSLGSQTDSSAGTTSNPPSTTKAIYRQYYGTALKQYRSRVTRAQAVTLCNTRVAYVEGRAASGKTTESDISKVKCMWGEEKIYPVDDTTSSLVLKISSISRSSGAIGAQVTIYGNGFLQNSKVSFIKNINTTTYQSETFVPDTVTVGADGKSLTFVVPSQVITDACRLASSATGYSACDELAFPVVSGPYSVRVKNENVTSNAVSFNVLNASTDCSAPGAMLTDACANQSNAGQGGSGSVLGVSTSALCADLPRNLHRGTESSSVSLLQSFLLEKGFMEGEVTGFYGDKTVEAVKDYQASRGLPTTGMVYDFTREAMRAESCR